VQSSAERGSTCAYAVSSPLAGGFSQRTPEYRSTCWAILDALYLPWCDPQRWCKSARYSDLYRALVSLASVRRRHARVRKDDHTVKKVGRVILMLEQIVDVCRTWP